MSNKQTAVEWLISQLNKQGFAQVVTDEEIEQAIKLERKQIEDAWNNGDTSVYRESAKQYYNEQFKKD